jgi:hypothetical protein
VYKPGAQWVLNTKSFIVEASHAIKTCHCTAALVGIRYASAGMRRRYVWARTANTVAVDAGPGPQGWRRTKALGAISAEKQRHQERSCERGAASLAGRDSDARGKEQKGGCQPFRRGS